MPPAFAAEAPTGELHVFVFEVGTGAPMRGVEVFAREPMPKLPLPTPDYVPAPPPTVTGEHRIGRTDRLGRLVVPDMPAGTWALYVESDGGIVEVGRVRISEGYRSEALVTTYQGERPPSALVEQPDEDQVRFGEGEDGPTGVVRGRLISSEDGAPVPNARVFVRGSRVDAVSDAEGRFSLEIPEGQRDLSIIHDTFATQAVNNVAVVAGQEASVEVELVPAGLALADFTIRAPRIEGGTSALLDERRNSSAVGDVLGAEQMARSGDSSAAAALTRVTGLTLVGGRFVYVRGLGERYSSVLLNGATLPSPEPSRRVVPLDMFPAGVLESVVIQKTYSPDMPGEFGGGSIQLRTKNLPTEPVFSIGVSGDYNSLSTFKQGRDYQGGAWDWIGAGARSRRLPEEIEQASSVARLQPSDIFCQENCYTAEQLESWGEQYPVDFELGERVLPPSVGLSTTLGTGGQSALFGRPAGILLGGSYANQWRQVSPYQNFYGLGSGPGGLSLQNEYNFDTTTNSVNASVILAAGMSPAEGHELRSTSLVLRRTSDEARVFTGYNGELDLPIRSTRKRYVERQLLVQQLTGEHALGGAGPELTWRYSYARATRMEPNRRGTQYNESADGSYIMFLRSGGNEILYSDLVDYNHDLGTELSIPLGPPVEAGELRPTLFVGGMVANKQRESATRRYGFDAQGDRARDAELLKKDPNDIFVPENIAADAFQFEEGTLPTDNYSAGQFLAAAYVKAELPLTSWLRAMAGARLEHSDQFTTTFPLFAAEGVTTIDSTIKTTDLLPSGTLTWMPSDAMNVRLAYGRTVSRPDFREMSPAPFFDVAGAGALVGNDELKRATIHNLDARWELYPSAGEVVSVGGFYKSFDEPIESILEVSTQRTTTWANTDSAWLYGVEADFRKNLEFVEPALRDFYVAGNVALIRSRISGITGRGTNAERPMQGQSPYVVNGTVGYDNPESGSFVTALYNVYGPRIMQAGQAGLPDIYQQPVHVLDVVVGVQTKSGLKLGVKASNLLNDPQDVMQSGQLTGSQTNGWNLGLKVGYKWGRRE